jgi:hypothetical protein
MRKSFLGRSEAEATETVKFKISTAQALRAFSSSRPHEMLTSGHRTDDTDCAEFNDSLEIWV